TSRGHDASVLEKQAPGRRSGRAQRWDDAIPCPLQVIHVKLNEPEVKITVDLSVDRIIVPMSCPPRGILARCRGGGAGCGTRERGATPVTSPGGGGEPSRGTKTAGRSDRTVEGVKPEMPRGAPSWRGASADAPGSGDPGPPGVIVRAVRRNPDNASSRRVTP